jgi:hypothetical protein
MELYGIIRQNIQFTESSLKNLQTSPLKEMLECMFADLQYIAMCTFRIFRTFSSIDFRYLHRIQGSFNTAADAGHLLDDDSEDKISAEHG